MPEKIIGKPDIIESWENSLPEKNIIMIYIDPENYAKHNIADQTKKKIGATTIKNNGK